MSINELQDATRKLLGWAEAGKDASNLRFGLIIDVQYPHLRNVTCAQCRTWWFDPIDGTVAHGQDGKPLRRPNPDDVLCETSTKCPKGHFRNPISLSAKNRQAWLHFQECDATGCFPDDPMVKHNASIIRDALSGIETLSR